MSTERCWNCDSERYFNTAAVESCPDCGIRCDYHGGGSNEAYDEATAQVRQRELDAEIARLYEPDNEEDAR